MPSFTANWSPNSETGTEGHAIALGTISFNKNIASMKSLLVGAIPLGATLSDGHGHSFTATAGHSSTDVLAWNLSGLSITPANDANFTLTLTATHSTSGVATASEAVTVNPLAPTVNWSPGSEEGTEGSSIALGTLSAAANGLAGDSNSIASVIVSAIPVNATLNDGHGHTFTASAGHTSVNVLGWNLSSLTITPANDANFTLSVTATEQDAQGNTSTASATETVKVDPLAPAVSWSPGSETGTAGNAIALGALSAAANGMAGDSNSIASLIVSGIPVDATLSDGHGHTFTATSGHTSTDVLGWTLSSLAITVGSPTTFTLTATATEHDANGDTSTASATENVTVNAASPGGYTYITIDHPLGTYGTYVLDINNSDQVAGDYQDDFDVSHGLHGFIYSGGTYHTIAPGGSTASYLFSINNSGEVAGYYNDGSQVHAFLYDGVGYTTLDPTLTTTQSIAYDLNDSGQIVGQYTDITGTHGFIYSAGVYTTLDYPGSSSTSGFSINDSGEVSGYYNVGFTAHGFFYDGTGFTPLDGPSAQFTYPSRINDAGEVTGYYYSSSTPHAFLYDSSSNTFTTLDFPGASATFGAGINSAGDIAGYTDGSTGRHAFVYDGANFTQLDDPFAINGTAALAINDSGDVGGSYATANTLGFVYDNGVYSDFNYPSSGATSPAAINDSGHIAGSYQNQTGQQHGFLYDGTSFASFDVPGTFFFDVLAVNNADEVLGTYDDNTGQHGFRYSGGSVSEFDVTLPSDPGASNTDPTAINDSGDIVGSYESGDFSEHGFLYDGSTYTTIDVPDGINTVYGTYANGINNAGDVVGYYYDDNYLIDGGQHGFFYDGTNYVTLDDPAALYGTQAVAINDTGKIAGNYYVASKQLGFVYDENAHNYTTIDDPNGLNGTRVLAINNAGEVLGTYYDTTGQHAFLYDASGYTTLDHPGAVFGTTAGGINDLGHVTGSYSPNSNFGFLAILS